MIVEGSASEETGETAGTDGDDLETDSATAIAGLPVDLGVLADTDVVSIGEFRELEADGIPEDGPDGFDAEVSRFQLSLQLVVTITSGIFFLDLIRQAVVLVTGLNQCAPESSGVFRQRADHGLSLFGIFIAEVNSIRVDTTHLLE